MSRSKSVRDRTRKHWCQLCLGAGFIPTSDPVPVVVGPDGKPVQYTPGVRRCPRLSQPVKPITRRSEKLDRQSRAAGENDDEV